MNKITVVFLILIICCFTSCIRIDNNSNSAVSETPAQEDDSEVFEVSNQENSNETTDISSSSTPEQTETINILDITADVTVIRVPLLEPLYAVGPIQWGGLNLTPESLIIGEPVAQYWEPDKGEPSYNEWIKKYTEEWFENNWLIVFTGPEYEFNIASIGEHITYDNGERVVKLFFIRTDERPEGFSWDKTYSNYYFVEIAKEDIPYELTNDSREFLYECMYYDTAAAYGYPVPEE